MCRMEVTGTSYAWQAVDTGFLPPNLRSSGSRADGLEDEDDDEEEASRLAPPAAEAPEKENIVAPSGAPAAQGQ